jgi:PAS domain S-box-containing protein
MNTLQVTIFITEAIIVALLVLFLFRMRAHLGLSPLYITLGVFQPIQTILASTFYVEILTGIVISPGSVIMFTASLFVILLVYIFEDAGETRKVIYGIILANLTVTLLLFISGMQLGLQNTINFLNLSSEILNQNAKLMLVGTSILFVDSILLIFVYEIIWRLISKNLFLHIFLTIALVLIFDSLAFSTGAFYGQSNYTTILVSNIVGKLDVALFYAFALTLYLRFAETTNDKTHPFRDIFHLLSYRQKFEIEHQRGQQAASLLRESQERYQTLVTISPVGIFRTDANGVTTYVNPKWSEIAGAPFNEALGDGWLNAVHPDDRERVSKGWQASTKVKKSSSSDYRFVRPDGKIVWVIGQAVPEKNIENQVVGYIGTITDITERKKAEEELRISEMKFSKTFRSSPDSITLSELESGRLVEVNDGFQKVFGYSREEAIGRTTLELNLYQNPEDRKQMLQTLAKQGRIRNLELKGCHKSGSGLIAQLSVEQIAINGAPYLVTVTRDITERVLMEDQVQRQLQRLEALHRIDMAITAGLDLNSSLELLLEQLVSILQVDTAVILLLEHHTDMLHHAISRGFKTNVVQHAKVPLGAGHAGRAASEKRLIYVHDLANNQDELSRALGLADEKFHSYFAVPLIVKGEVKGILEIFHRSFLDPNQDWLNFVETIANRAAISIEDAQLFSELQRSNIELTQAYDATIKGWSRALDLRDKETEGHAQRVTEKTLELARLMGIHHDELVHIRRGALLHDIGKMGVPDEILLKAGKLNEQEWELMKQHPTFAFEMLSPIHYLKSAAIDIPYCHHEKWDGTGYPRGLKGEQIPIAARIFAVVDVWDAITSDRPYRSAWTKENALEYLREQTGKHFDPQIVDVFMSLIKER